MNGVVQFYLLQGCTIRYNYNIRSAKFILQQGVLGALIVGEKHNNQQHVKLELRLFQGGRYWLSGLQDNT